MNSSSKINNPLVSIIMPTYNSSQHLVESLNSILLQTFGDWELVVTDDCSSDNTLFILKEFASKDERIVVLSLEKNQGAGIARNNSLSKAKGRFIAFCDSDDLWMPDKLEKQIKFMSDNAFEFVFCKSLIIDSNSRIVGINNRVNHTIYWKTCLVNYIGTSGVVYDTYQIGKIYMKDIRARQDWILWIDILKKVKRAYCYPGEPLSLWRKSEKSISSDKSKLHKYHIKVYEEYMGIPKIGAVILFYSVSLPLFFIKKIRIKIDSTRYLKSLCQS